MAGTRRARGDRQTRLAAGLAMLTISSVSLITFWSSRRHPVELLHTAGFWVGVAFVLIAVFILGSTLPTFQQPELGNLVGNELPFRRDVQPDDLDVEMVDHTDKSRVGVRMGPLHV
jgi:hypothetical protein